MELPIYQWKFLKHWDKPIQKHVVLHPDNSLVLPDLYRAMSHNSPDYNSPQTH